MRIKTTLLVMLVLFVCGTVVAYSQETGDQPDKLCQMLFDSYITGGGKVNTSTYLAAAHIIAERGRTCGFWQEVLKELRNGKEATEGGCVHLLGKMLEVDAAARDVIRRERETGEIGQWLALVCLPPEVVMELVTRGKQADRFRADQYAIALARARVPEATDFLRMILQDNTGKNYPETTKYYAALGLAQLGDPLGFEWLVEKCDECLPVVWDTWPSCAAHQNLDICCKAVLQELSGRKDITNKQEWEEWWKQTGKKALPHGHVVHIDP